MSYRPTKRQKDALDFIKAYGATNEIAPTIDEIRNGLGLASKGSAHRLIVSLEERGLVRRLSGRARAIEITVTGERQ